MASLALAAPAAAQTEAPGVGGYPARQYAPTGRSVEVHAYNPSEVAVRVGIGSDVKWLIPALDSITLEPNEQSPIGVVIVRPVPLGAVGHITLLVRNGEAAGGVGLEVVNQAPPPKPARDGAGWFAWAAVVAALVLVASGAWAVTDWVRARRRRRAARMAWGRS